MEVLSARDYYVQGPLMERALRSYDRLETDLYNQKGIFQTGDYSWPGDWEGRALLGLILLAKTTHRSPKDLHPILNALPEHLNKGCYFGIYRENNEIDEQQLAGNSWFLRAMCEYYEWTNDPQTYNIIYNIAEQLIIPGKDFFHYYPLTDDDRNQNGKEMGELISTVKDGWHLSTDTGCAFILLDGASHAYKILKNEKLGEVIDILIRRFMEADVVKLKFQTHATLSATRGILRQYENTGTGEYLEFAKTIFDQYIAYGMTANYANYNWFQRPEWTEPCAYIDSYIIAMELFRFTRNFSYLEIAQKIYFNAIGFGQRINGGFGIENCCGANERSLHVKNEGSYEAYWCCTMRGGEGLSKAISYQCMKDGDCLWIVQPNDNVIRYETQEGMTVIRQYTRYPAYGDMLLEILYTTMNVLKVNIYIPPYVDANTISLLINGTPISKNIILKQNYIELVLDPRVSKKIELTYAIPLRKEKTNKNHIQGVRYFHGFSMLGAYNQDVTDNSLKNPKQVGPLVYEDENGIVLRPLYDNFRYSKNEFMKNNVQVIFEDSPAE